MTAYRWEEGQRAQVTEMRDRRKRDGGQVFGATVTQVTELYVIITYDPEHKHLTRGGTDQFWRESGWRAWDGDDRWRLFPVREPMSEADIARQGGALRTCNGFPTGPAELVVAVTRDDIDRHRRVINCGAIERAVLRLAGGVCSDWGHELTLWLPDADSHLTYVYDEAGRDLSEQLDVSRSKWLRRKIAPVTFTAVLADE